MGDEFNPEIIESLLHREYDKVSLAEVETLIRNCFLIVGTLNDAGPHELTNEIQGDLNSATGELRSAIKQAQSLNLMNSDFHQKRQNTLNSFQSVWNRIGRYRPYALSLQVGHLQEVTRDAQAALGRVEAITQEARHAKEEAEAAASAAKQAAALSAVSNLSAAYKEEADTFNGRAKLWGGISLAIAISGAVLIYVYVHSSVGRTDFTVSQAILRAVAIGAVFADSVCMRVFEGYRHLEVVNRHRVNIGRTFEAFKEAQPSDRAKEIMAAVTAEQMLAFGKSGLIPKDASVQSPVSGLSELLKAIIEKRS